MRLMAGRRSGFHSGFLGCGLRPRSIREMKILSEEGAGGGTSVARRGDQQEAGGATKANAYSLCALQMEAH